MKQYNNPILPGFYPDPSVCRVNEDYYLVTSSFEYFPGVPIFHSKDLVHWEQIGHVLDRPSQLELDGIKCSDGIYAPTIRYNDGTFYMITTIVGVASPKSNFLVTATRPEGPWSDPVWLNDAPGIDPSMYFDDDGKAYCTGNMIPPEGENYPGHRDIWIQEFDVDNLCLIGQRYTILKVGAMNYAEHVEASHIYKKDGKYYLLVAEGGTKYYHSMAIFRSDHVCGDYEINPGNPILTHRHLGRMYPIVNTGHGDLVESQNGEWWMILLASRPYGGYYRNLGRETFLAPVEWEEGWPIVCPMTGKVEFQYDCPDLEAYNCVEDTARDNFDEVTLGFKWNFIRTPRDDFWSLSDRKGYLRLNLKADSITDHVNPSFIGRRQQHINFSAKTVIEFSPSSDNESAGLVILQNNNYQFRLEIIAHDHNKYVRLTKREDGVDACLSECKIDSHRVYLMIQATGQAYSFFYGDSENTLIALVSNVDGRILSSEIAGGFVGTYVGMYASSNGLTSSNYADYDWFEYLGLS